MATGSIIAQVFTSRGAIPVADAVVCVTTQQGSQTKLEGMRLTNREGSTTPITLETPAEALSQAPSAKTPFAVCDLHIEHPRYYAVLVKQVQVFANTLSEQIVELIPLEAGPLPAQTTETFVVEPQNL